MMMNVSDVSSEIKDALATLPGQEFSVVVTKLLDVLGYRSDLLPDSQPADVDDFIRLYAASTPDTKTEQSFRESVESIQVLFQFTDQEVSAQSSLFKVAGFDTGNARSFLFAAVDLKDHSYSRGNYATFAREINKRWQIPTVVLFRTPTDLLTLAFVHRRPNRRDPDRDVLGSVSLIREIDPSNPHRAHLEVLCELSLDERLRWMNSHGEPQNFDGLLTAWLDALDTEELNRRFYKDLFAWFQRAVNDAHFPTDEAITLSAEEHVIRLITRLLFVWFIKEKGLVDEDLFVENQVSQLLKEYDSENGDSYYRAVLQNLFFATLNTEIDRRGFSSQTNATHRDFSRYRYAAEIVNPDGLLALFDKSPFINGGLFDCLDSDSATGGGGYRVDCFTDNPTHRGDYSIPNRLFFASRDEREPGLITLFNRYKFTVEENTPAEQEVALDPELLGKVFEHLLAAYNPETKENARKQTGSYYTPRDVVNYMVDEALVVALTDKVSPPGDNREWWEDRLHYLLDYGDAFDDAEELFASEERDAVVRAIAGLRVLDPAVGSGAFPMGVLHKLTLALRRLDPNNARWESLQKEVAGQRAADAFGTTNRLDRDKELAEISETFEHYRDSDLGRKLYLIQNSIYGVDIQPVATQIAKLRFFISLAIEQQQPTGDSNDNYGIRPLPNLETRFVAANTLLGLSKPAQMTLGQTNAVNQLQHRLNENRERHFHANSRQLKLACRREDVRLRRTLASALREADFAAIDADMVAEWDPYDQNGGAEWFDPAYMFGVKDGFDVVIGNPPYVQLQKDGGRLGRLYRNSDYTTFASTGDIYQLFYERGFKLLTDRGVLSYITSNSWLKAEYGKSTRQYMASNHAVLRLLETGKEVFENVIVDTNVLIGRSGNASEGAKAVDMNRLSDRTFPPDEKLWSDFHPRSDMPWSVLSPIEQSVMDKMLAAGTPLKDWDIAIYRGVLTGYNKAFIIDNQTKETLVAQDQRSKEIIKPVLRGKDIQRFRAKWADMWIIDTHNGYDGVPAINVDDYPAIKTYLDGHFEQLEKRYDKGQTPYNLRNCAYHAEFVMEKLLLD